MVSKAIPKKFYFGQTQKKFVLKLRLNIRIRNLAPLSEPPTIVYKNLYFSPKFPTQRDFMVQKSRKSKQSKISHLAIKHDKKDRIFSFLLKQICL